MIDKNDENVVSVRCDLVGSITAVQPPSALTITAANGRKIVTFHNDGRVEVDPSYTTDEAALAFLETIVRIAPGFFKSKGE